MAPFAEKSKMIHSLLYTHTHTQTQESNLWLESNKVENCNLIVIWDDSGMPDPLEADFSVSSYKLQRN